MLKTLKRILWIGFGAAILVIVFFPAREEVPADGKIHLDYWYVTGQKEEIPYTVRRFNEIQDSIVIKPTAIPWQEAEKKILTAILSGDPPDVIDQFVPVVKWASRMGLVPLDPYIQESGFDGSVFFPSLWAEMHWQDHVFAIPVSTASFALYYNKAHLREAGIDPLEPPRTWEEIRRLNHKLVRYDEKGNLTRAGYLFHLGPQLKVSQQADDTPHLMAFQKGVRFLNEDGDSLIFANETMANILQWIIDAQNFVPYSTLQAFTAGFGYGDQHAFISGKVSMMIMGSNFTDNITRYNPDLDFGITLIPSFEGTPTASTTGSWWMAVPRGSGHPEAAWKFISFCARAGTQKEAVLATEESLFPANKHAAGHPDLLKNHADSIFYNQMLYARSTTVVPLAHDVFWREYYAAVERAVHGVQQPLEALQQASAIIQSELDGAVEYDQFVRGRMPIGASF